MKKSFDYLVFILSLVYVKARQEQIISKEKSSNILPFYLYIMSTATFEKRDFDFSKYGAFFCFWDKQFEEKSEKWVKYVNLWAGLIARKDNYKEVVEKFNKHCEDEKKRRTEEQWLESIIKYELNNHEVYYTGDLTDVMEILKEYWAEEEEVRKIFLKERDIKADNNEI